MSNESPRGSLKITRSSPKKWHSASLARQNSLSSALRSSRQDPGDYPALWRYHRRFFLEDGGGRVAKQLGVLAPDTGENLHFRGDDRGSVQPASEPGFDDGHVAPLLLEVEEGGGGQDLELREVLVRLERLLQLIHHRPHPRHEVAELLVGRREGIDHLPLGQTDEVRRGVGSDSVSLRLQQGGDEPRGRGLSIGAHHVDGPVGQLGGAKRIHQLSHPLEAETGTQPLEAVHILPDLPRLPRAHFMSSPGSGSRPPTRSS